MEMSNFYSPKPKEQGYFYHVEIQEQVQLTYEQYLTQENRGKEVCTSDPDDDTDYQKINWYKDTRTSFANKEWDELVKEIRNTFKRYGNVMLQQKENGTHYVYYFGRTLWLKEKVLKRASIFITHKAIIEMNQEKFMDDLTRIDSKRLKEEQPELYKQYTKESKSRKFTVK